MLLKTLGLAYGALVVIYFVWGGALLAHWGISLRVGRAVMLGFSIPFCFWFLRELRREAAKKNEDQRN